MRSDLAGQRLGTLAVLVALLVVMSLACSLPVARMSASAATAPVPTGTAERSVEVEDTSGAEERSHVCGVPESPPSLASNPLLDPLTLLPVLDLFEPAPDVDAPPPAQEDVPPPHGEGLLTLLCVQRV
ncbi:hypothetical protein [Nocardiopsis sp. MG754419]|uniref:hypothetical protein n=1 Tax=Nocardiopsis sp. MG754419 TaxID=2259865 RepID=UPI001BADB167|nr:hypothetical protein [Nocardiopsis sp. MG754419]MBR8740124.1 hypothetical protein [Nocardiopsis sp. MG754419]